MITLPIRSCYARQHITSFDDDKNDLWSWFYYYNIENFVTYFPVICICFILQISDTYHRNMIRVHLVVRHDRLHHCEMRLFFDNVSRQNLRALQLRGFICTNTHINYHSNNGKYGRTAVDAASFTPKIPQRQNHKANCRWTLGLFLFCIKLYFRTMTAINYTKQCTLI